MFFRFSPPSLSLPLSFLSFLFLSFIPLRDDGIVVAVCSEEGREGKGGKGGKRDG